MRAFELFGICSGVFGPSSKLRLSLLNHLIIIEESESPEVSRLARYCISRLEKTYENGSRMVLPSEEEIEHMKALKPYPIKIYMLSGSSIIILAESFTNANDLKIAIISRLKIPLSKFSKFGLYEIFQDGDYQERYIEENELIMDLVCSWAGKQGSYKILIKMRFIVETHSKDPLLPFIYMQHVFDVLRGISKVSDKIVAALAALKLLIDLGKGRIAEGYLENNLNYYIPSTNIKESPETAEKLIRKAISKYNTLNEMNKSQAQVRYVEILNKQPLIACNIFFLHFHEASGRYTLPKEIMLGVNMNSLSIFSANYKRELMKFDYSQISSWGESTDRLALFVSLNGYQVEFLFKTHQSQVITSILKGYTSLKLNQPIDNHLSPNPKAREIGLSRALSTKFAPLPFRLFK